MKPFYTAAIEEEVREIVALVNTSFQEMPDKMSRLHDHLGLGMKKAVVDGWPDDEVETVYTQAHELYEAQHYQEALPLALHLSVNRPLDPRFMFMTGMILQLLGDPLLGAAFYSTLLALDPNFMPAAYRMAECYTALGEHKDAREIFETAIDMGQGTLGDADEFYALQRIICERLRSSN
jgi:tetratricopeptide (TPR) repeat protein